MKPTKDCPAYPGHYGKNTPLLPLLHMSDEEVDQMLAEMQRRGELKDKEIPKTQYGRRVACDTLFRLERYKGQRPVRTDFWRTDDLR